MEFLDLFSGIGGFTIGLEKAGMRCVAHCEINPYAQSILKKHWPHVPLASDIHKLSYNRDTQELIYDQEVIYRGPIRLICGGFPCQPWSVAGKQRGEEDDRHLWPEYLRLIREIRPRWVIGENVAGLINMGLDSVLSDLEGEGYTTESFVIPAVALNARHRRDRIWIVAHADDCASSAERGKGEETNGVQGKRRKAVHSGQPDRAGEHAEVLANTNVEGLEGMPDSGRPEEIRSKRNQRSAGRGNDGRAQADAHADSTRLEEQRAVSESGGQAKSDQGCDEDVADTMRRRQQGSRSPGNASDSAQAGQGKTVKPRDGGRSRTEIRSLESRLGGMADGLSIWAYEPPIPRVAAGVKDRTNRLKCLGNAVVPFIPEVLANCIMHIEEGGMS